MTATDLRDTLAFIVTNERMSRLHGQTIVLARDVDAIIAAARQEAAATLRADNERLRAAAQLVLIKRAMSWVRHAHDLDNVLDILRHTLATTTTTEAER